MAAPNTQEQDADDFLAFADGLIASLSTAPLDRTPVAEADAPAIPNSVWHAVQLELGRQWLHQLLEEDPAQAHAIARVLWRRQAVSGEWLVREPPAAA
jgi:hypothetical protein